MNPQDNEWNILYLQNTKITLQAKVFKFDDPLQFGSEVYSFASSDENNGCESSSGQGTEKARDNPSMATRESQEQEGGCYRSTKRRKESPLCYIDGHMSLQEFGVRNFSSPGFLMQKMTELREPLQSNSSLVLTLL